MRITQQLWWSLLGVCMLVYTASGATWVWNAATGNWNTAANWSPATVPTSATTTFITFGSGTSSNNNRAGAFRLNQLNFNNTFTNAFSLTGNQLRFDGTAPTFNMNSNYNVSVSNNILMSVNTTFGGTGGGTATVSGVLSGASRIATFSGSNYVLSNLSNSFSGGLVVSGGSLTGSSASAITINTTGNSILGAGTISATGGNLNLSSSSNITLNRNVSLTGTNTVNNWIAGGNITLNTSAGITLNNNATLNLQSTGAGTITTSNNFTFGTAGGLLNYASLANASASTYTINTTGVNYATIRYNTMPSATSIQGWDTSQAFTVGTISGTGNVRLSMLSGAIFQLSQTTYGGSMTFSGVSGGNAGADSLGTNVGRFAINTGTYNIAGGLFLENATQVGAVGGAVTINNNITVMGGETAFQGRATGSVVTPSANRLTLSGTNLTIQNGAIATMDIGYRTDSSTTTIAGINLNAGTIINAGGTLQFKQSFSNVGSTYDNIVVNGNVTGQGTDTNESRLLIQNSVLGVIATDTGSRNIVFPATTNMYVQGSGLGGLRVEGSSANVNGVLTSNRLQNRVLSVGSPSTDQGTLTIAYTDSGTRTFTASDGPSTASWIKLGFDAAGGSPVYTLNNSAGSGGSLGNWNGLVIKGGTVTVLSNLTFTGASNNPTLYLAGGTLNLSSGTLSFAGSGGGSAELRSGTITGGIGGGTLSVKGDIIKTTAGTVTIGGKITTSSPSATLDIQGGTILMNGNNLISNNINLKLSGSGSTLALNGYSQNLGTLTLSSTSTIDFGTGTNSLTFANSSATTWTGGAQLIITNFTTGQDTLSFGTGGLTNSQLSQIWFQDPSNSSAWYRAMIDASGHVRPIPEPSTILGGIFLVMAALGYELYRRRR